MIWSFVLALAATPAQLEAAVPDALQVLSACAEEGCDADEGAQAAWIVALHRYGVEGVADRDLAATVALLDAELFASLPDVVQGAQGRAPEWADLAASVRSLPGVRAERVEVAEPAAASPWVARVLARAPLDLERLPDSEEREVLLAARALQEDGKLVSALAGYRSLYAATEEQAVAHAALEMGRL